MSHLHPGLLQFPVSRNHLPTPVPRVPSPPRPTPVPRKENPDSSHHPKLRGSVAVARRHTDVTRTTTSPESPSRPRSFRGTSPGQKGANQRQVHGRGPGRVGAREGPSGPKVARGNQSVLGATSEAWPVLVSSRLTYAHQVHEAVHAVADLEEDVAALPDGLRAEGRPQQPGEAGHQEERAQEHGDDLHLLHQGDADGLPLCTGHKREPP
ncbi:hypothetical protein EYF80_030535 [Liparis tanakae]|uniref:Uncharacterized protein n=1 Tax=Liparis tanakae TaxID=230148 RepID=A0A4Z2H1C5_9TELE|nr:hypothetical protein EYF80_030535 [Liparis tanakae]